MQRSSLAAVLFLAGCANAPAQSPSTSRPSFPAAPSFPGAASMPRASSDSRATAVADRVMDALGGKEAWDATRFLRFTFGSERDGKFMGRTHTWDKWTGRYRVEGERDGARFVTLMNVNTREGSAWMNGKSVEGEALKAQLERGYGAWVNDTYWLLMPYKLKDPGVIRTYAGEEKGDGGAMYDKVKLTFDGVGLTPRDAYWVWVNRDTGMVDRWDFVLKGESAPPTTFTWTGWKKYGGIMLAGERMNPADNRKILLPDIAVLESVPDSVFTSPDPIR